MQHTRAHTHILIIYNTIYNIDQFKKPSRARERRIF